MSSRASPVLRVAAAAIAGFTGWCVALNAGYAASGPVIVVPGHLGVPVIINGIDATGAKVYGDWGLARPGEGIIVIEGGTPAPRGRRPVRYFPSSIDMPDRGPTEAQPPPARPSTSTDFHRSWSVGPGSAPPTIVPDAPPPAIVLPSPPNRVPGGTVRP